MYRYSPEKMAQQISKLMEVKSREQLADESGLSDVTISRAGNRKLNPRITTFETLCALTGKAPSFFFVKGE